MGQLSARSFDAADEVRTFDKGRLEMLTPGSTIVGRAIFEPGWRWSECVEPRSAAGHRRRPT